MIAYRKSFRTNSVMFAAHYDDGRTAYFVIEDHGKPSEDYLASTVARGRQESGDLPDGKITTVKRVR